MAENAIRIYTIPEVAEIVHVSPRWLADQCRAGRVTHLHIAHRRLFNQHQLDELIAQHTVTPNDPKEQDPIERLRRNLDRAGTPKHPCRIALQDQWPDPGRGRHAHVRGPPPPRRRIRSGDTSFRSFPRWGTRDTYRLRGRLIALLRGRR